MAYKDPEKLRAYRRTYRQANSAKLAEHDKAYRTKNRERLAAPQRKKYLLNRTQMLAKIHARYRLKHPEKMPEKQHKSKPVLTEEQLLANRARVKAWRKANPDRDKINKAKKRARKHNAPINDFTAQQWRTMKAHYGYACVYCGDKPPILTKDHITPLEKGGSNTIHNIVPACFACNNKKNVGPPPVPVQPMLL